MTAPAWSPVDDDTADLLAELAEDRDTAPMAVSDGGDKEWTAFLTAVRTVAGFDGMVTPNAMRTLLRAAEVTSNRIGPFYRRACREGILRPDGWQISDDRESNNTGRPARTYRVASWQALGARA